MMGDDGEKFGAWPTTYEHCWGESRWVDRFFTALEANADWLSTVTPSAWLARERPDRAGLHPDGLLRRDGPVGAAGEREPPVHRAPAPRRGRGPARGSLAARRVLAQLPGQVPRDQRPPQADAAHVGGGRRDGAPAGVRDAALGPSVPGPVQRLLLARPVRRHLHQPHATRHVRAPDRRRGPRPDGRRLGRVGRRSWTSTWTASTTCASGIGARS